MMAKPPFPQRRLQPLGSRQLLWRTDRGEDSDQERCEAFLDEEYEEGG